MFATSSGEDFSVLLEGQSSPEDQPKELTPLAVGSLPQMKFDSLEENQISDEKLQLEKKRLIQLQQEESELLQKIQSIKTALREEKILQDRLEQQEDVWSCLPERDVSLALLTAQTGDAPAFDINSHIVYPMDGGTALITFEEEAVAKKILKIRKHVVNLGLGYRITVEAQPVQLVVPTKVEIDSAISPRCILVSDLPQMDTESLVDKLGFHFSKKANGGGDVEMCQVLEDTRTAVITFSDLGIVDTLVLKQFHDIQVQDSKHRVRVMPFVNGLMSRPEVQMQVCSRMVLLRGIPDVLNRDTLQEFLVDHFCQGSNAGGKVLGCLYNPLGQHTSAIFSGQSVIGRSSAPLCGSHDAKS